MFGRLFRPTFSELARDIHRAEASKGRDASVRKRPRPKGSTEQPQISFAGHRVPLDSLDHIAVVGQSGSGKNLVMGPTFRTLVEAVAADPTRRMLVIEVKPEWSQALQGMGVDFDLLTFTYQEGSSWNVAKDFASSHLLSQLGYNLLPNLEGNNAFFRHGARALNIAGAVSIDEVTQGEWGIDDLVNLAFADPETMRSIMARSETGQRILHTFLSGKDSEETLFKLRAELAAWFFPLLLPAAKYQISDALSLVDFWEGYTRSPILVVKLNPERLDAEKAIASALIQRSFEFIMGKTPHFDPTKRRKDHLIWLDDFNFYRKLPKSLEATELIRGCGGLIIALFQSVEGLRSRESYGDEADALLANFSNYLLLRAGSPTTAKWGASLFGQRVRIKDAWGTGFGKEGAQGRVDVRRSIESRVLDSDIMGLRKPSPANGVEFYLKTDLHGDEFRKHLPWDQVLRRHPPKAPVTFTPIPRLFESPGLWSEDRRDFLATGKKPLPKRPVAEDGILRDALSQVDEEIRRVIFDIGMEAIERIVQDVMKK